MRLPVLLFAIVILGACTNGSYKLNSPNNELRIDVKLPAESNQNTLSFDVYRSEKLISTGNQLALELKSENGIFNQNLRLLSFRRFYIDNLLQFEGQVLKNNANGIRFMLANAEGRNLDVVFRVYDDAIAYQYELYNDSLDVLIKDFSTFDSQPNMGLNTFQIYDSITPDLPAILPPNYVMPWKALLITDMTNPEKNTLKTRLLVEAEFAY